MKVLVLVVLALIALAQDNYEFGPSIMVNADAPGTHFRATTQRSIACRGGTVYLSWRDDRDYNPQIFFSKSTDAGATWSTNVMVSQGWDTTNCFLPHLALDASGNIYVAYCAKSENNNDRDIYFTRSIDGSVSFSEPIMVNDSAVVQWQTNCAITVDSAGQNVYVVWEDSRNGHDEDIYLARSIDSGVSFLSSVRVNDDLAADQWSPVVACDSSGQNVYIAWMDFRDTLHGAGVYFCRSTDNGQTFNANYRVNDTTSRAEWPSIYYRNAIIYCAWRDERGNSIYFNKSTDGGVSFGLDTEVRDNATGAGMYPSITADDSHNVYVVWYDTRTLWTTGYDIYFSYSDDGGVTFQPNVRVNDLLGITSAWDMRPAIAVNQSGTVFVTWDSDRNSQSGACNDIYFASGELTGIHEVIQHRVNPSGIEIFPTIFKDCLSIRLYTIGSNKTLSEIMIYDITGRVVKQYNKLANQLNNEVLWDGTDDAGHSVSEGVYFVRLETPDFIGTEKVILLK